MIQAVIVTVESLLVPATPIEGVLVYAYDVNYNFTGVSGVTGVDGKAVLMLDDAESHYIVYAKKQGVSSNPASIQMSSPYPIEVTYKVADMSIPFSVNPDKCTISGYLVDSFGNPLPQQVITISPTRRPLVVNRSVLTKGNPPPSVVTDALGHAQFELFRKATYDVVLGETSDILLTCEVPDKAQLDLVDFLFPIIKEIDIQNSATVNVGEQITLPLDLILSNGISLFDSEVYSEYSLSISSDNNKVISSISGQELILRGVSTGTTILTLTVDNSEYGERLPPITVTAQINVLII